MTPLTRKERARKPEVGACAQEGEEDRAVRPGSQCWDSWALGPGRVTEGQLRNSRAFRGAGASSSNEAECWHLVFTSAE